MTTLASRSGIACGTSIYTQHGDKPVESLQPGDLVLSYPKGQVPPERMREESEMTYSPVSAITTWEAREVVELDVLCFAAGVRETLRVASSQQVFVEKQGWISAGSLPPTTVLVNSAFGNNMCTGAKRREEAVTFFEISLETDHSFYIGRSDTWVRESV